ncbi:hypothetical protein [Pedobacter cryophilus]|uniref:Uncharacterized protein n=1 Tax=Pedobacter cryophilus TaxID=2571271 RepID=A0A4U1C496_9SPHI|nr:hypothetical protein [Pedobacter cryophilus]TKC00179.1 hypothetical protein FA046_00410 [Pedobacter cryophilus]
MNSKSNLRKTDLKAYLTESSKDYIFFYQSRLEYFIENIEGNEIEYLEDEILFFNNCVHDYQNVDSLYDRYTNLNDSDFSVLISIIENSGADRFYYSTKRKLEFLVSRKQNVNQVNTINLDFKDNISPSNDIDKPFKKQKTNKKKESLSQIDFFNEIRHSVLTALEIYTITEKITSNFSLKKLQLLQEDFESYLFKEKEIFDKSIRDEKIKDCFDFYERLEIDIPLKEPIFQYEKDIVFRCDNYPDGKVPDLERMIYHQEFIPCYKFLALIKDEISKISQTDREYSKFDIITFNKRYYISFNSISNHIKINLTQKELENDLEDSLFDLKKTIKFTNRNNKEVPLDEKQTINNWINSIITLCDNEFQYTNNPAFKWAIDYCQKLKNNLGVSKTNEVSSSESSSPPSFSDLFITQDWLFYILALSKLDTPLIDESLNYIGPIRGGKGIICNWILTLQKKGKIKPSIKRQILSEVLNNEISGLNLGKDGSTFSKFNKDYLNNWENKLLKLAGLLP